MCSRLNEGLERKTAFSLGGETSLKEALNQALKPEAL
jgi:hypothetical protein